MFAVPPQLPVSPSPPSTQSRTKVIDDQVVGAATGGFRLWQATLFPAERGARTSVIYNCYLRNAGSPTERLSNNRIPCPTSMCSLGSTTGRIPGFLHDPTATARLLTYPLRRPVGHDLKKSKNNPTIARSSDPRIRAQADSDIRTFWSS